MYEIIEVWSSEGEEVAALKTHLSEAKVDWEGQLKEALAQGKEGLHKKDKEKDAAISEATIKVVSEFKILKEFHQHLQIQNVMIVMLSQLLAKIHNLSPSFPIHQLKSLELQRLWEAVESAAAPVVLPLYPAIATTEISLEEASSQILTKHSATRSVVGHSVVLLLLL